MWCYDNLATLVKHWCGLFSIVYLITFKLANIL